jgi:hypothetical protein
MRRSVWWLALALVAVPRMAAAHFPVVDVDLPAGALPPGPAVVTVERADEVFREELHVRVRAGEPLHVRLNVRSEGTVTVVARGAGGAIWRGSALAIVEPFERPPIFVGSGDELDSFGRAPEQRHGPDSVSTLVLRSPADGERLDCEWVIDVLLVATRPSDHLLDCAARGAHLVMIGGHPALAPFPPGVHHLWGIGTAGWVESMTAAADSMPPRSRPARHAAGCSWPFFMITRTFDPRRGSGGRCPS